MTEKARVVVRSVSKTFGATRALAGVDLEVRTGEVHTVMGENGSGKSTLVKILSGVHRPDSGSIMVNGHSAGAMRSPADARRLGVSTVFQEVLTVPGQSILQNIWLGAGKTGLTRAQQNTRAAELLARLLGEPIDVSAPIETLSLSGRQAACIVRSLVHDPSVLILDESTSALDIATRDRLFEVVRERTREGASAVFISHRMDEVFQVSDVITVLRSGATVAPRVTATATSPGAIVKLMSGVDADKEQHPSRATERVVLRTADLRIAPESEPVNLDLHGGELLGLAGLEGQGQDTFLKSLRGIGGAAGSVTRLVEGGEEVVTSPRRARDLGIAYVPRERRREGIFEQLAISENFGLPALGQDTVLGVISGRRTIGRLTRLARPLRLKMGHHRDLITTLSGGNQQKVIIARALADTPAVLLLNDPTRGIDHHAKHDVYAALAELCRRGVAVVILSSEVDELVHLADRVLVFKDRTLSASLRGDGITRDAIVAAYFGADVEEKGADHVDRAALTN